MRPVAWHEDEDKFFRELDRGEVYQTKVALFIERYRPEHYYLPDDVRHTAEFEGFHPYEVWINPPDKRKDLQDAARFKSDCDIWCEGMLIEVKSRREVFTWDPRSWLDNYDSVFINTVESHSAKSPKPDAMINISQRTGAMFWLYIPRYHSEWEEVEKDDGVRGIRTKFWTLAVENEEGELRWWPMVPDFFKVLRRFREREAWRRKPCPPKFVPLQQHIDRLTGRSS
jgi:hypothetical protein